MTARSKLAGAATLAMDELLTDPDAAALLARIRDTAPIWYRDQADAAGDQIAHGLATAAKAMNRDVVTTPAVDHPAWVRLGALRTIAGWLAGEGSTCMHAPDPSRPQPLGAAAWRPGLIFCGKCTHLMAIAPGSDLDRTCDGCGRITTGAANDDGIWPVTVQIGLLTYAVGCCRDCKYWPDPTEENE